MYKLPKYVRDTLKTLSDAGHESYIVGGAVRDLMLGKNPTDYDVTTSAAPNEVVCLFRKTVNTGIKHGTVTAIVDNFPVEITTFRSDGNYSNHRSPENVQYLKSIDGDLARRDFTINAMAYNADVGVIDLFGGKKDLTDGIIRAVGNPEKRFEEDALRILRAVRFAAKLNFKIEKITLDAVIKKSDLLKFISRERIFSEISKILVSDNPQFISVLLQSGALDFLGLSYQNNLQGLCGVSNSLPLRFYTLARLCDADPIMLCTSLKADGKLKYYCRQMQLSEQLALPPDRENAKILMFKTDAETAHDFFEFKNKAEGKSNYNSAVIDEIITSKEPYNYKQLNIGGEDITALGVKGKDVGKILEELMYEVIKYPQKNRKDILIKTAVTKISRIP